MADTSRLILPLIASNQAQKHITHNESLVKLDALVQLAVISQTLTAPPGSPVEGDRYIIAAGATGAWATKDFNIAAWTAGAWAFYPPRTGWVCYVAATSDLWTYSGSAWVVAAGGGGGGSTFTDAAFTLTDDADVTKVLKLQLSGITTGTTRTLTVPNASDTLAVLGATQTFTGVLTFSGTFAVTAATATLGNSTGTSTQNVGTGATTTGVTKTVNLGTGGASGSTTVVNVGSTTAGALGSLIVNTPTVTFASSVTAIGAAAANMSILRLGIGGATADATNQLSVNTPSVLFNRGTNDINVTLNKQAAADDARFTFRTNFSTRALFGTLGADDFALSVSPNGSSFFTAFSVAAATGRTTLSGGIVLNPAAGDIATPADGSLWYNSTTGKFRAREAGATVNLISAGGGGSTFADNAFTLQDDADATKQLVFQLSGITTATTRTLTAPNLSGTLMLTDQTQTVSGAITFSNVAFTASAATTATIAAATAATTVNIGTGATLTATSKTLNLGTGGVSGSTTNVNIGSATAGALGTTTVNSPNLVFSTTNTNITINGTTSLTGSATTAALLYLGLGGATADATNRLSINTPAVLLNNAGTSIDMTFNKNAVGNDASMSFKTGFSTRGLVGLLGDDDLSFKVSPDGSTFYTGFIVKGANGTVEFPQALVLQEMTSLPAAPPSTKLALYARTRAGQAYLDVQRPSGRDFPLQPHLGVNRIATWNPSTATTVTAVGMPITNVGTVSHPTPAATDLKTSMRSWTVTSAAVVNSVAEQRSAINACWRGNAAGLGGWTYTNRLSLTTLQATGMGFFGLYAGTGALATTLLLSAVINCVGIGFQRGTHTNWQMVQNDATGAPTLTDLGASFPINNTDVLTLFVAAAPNSSSIGVRVVNENSGAVYEATLTTDIPATTTFLAPRNYMNNEATAAAVAFDSAGSYLETDY